MDVATCFTGLVDNQRDSAMLRDAIQHLPPVRMAIPATTAFKGVMEASEFPIALWPRRFMEQEMGAAILYCQLGGEEIDGPERAEALKRTFEYIAEKLCDVVFVFQVCESRGSYTYTYLVTLFSDGSHLCQCRTLQVLGLCCRHFWAAMIHSRRFRFHVGLLHEHWLAEKARGTPEGDWPSAATPKWIAADRHGGAAAGTDGFQGTAAACVGGGWKAFVGSSQTVQTVLLDLREKGPTEQDKQVLYADVSKTLALTCSILSDSFSPEAAKALVNNFYASVRTQAQAQTGIGGVGELTAFVGNPNTVRLPPRAGNSRKRGAAEGRGTRAGSKRTATSGS